MKTLCSALMILLLVGCAADEEAVAEGSVPDDSTISAPPRFERPGVGDTLEAFDVLTLDGDRWTFDAAESELTMINLWATWCVPCREEIPELIALQNLWGEKGLAIVGVSLDSPGMADQIREYVESVDVNYTIVHDARQELLKTLKTPVIPTTALVNSDGEIVWMHLGIVEENDPALNEILVNTLGSGIGS